MYQNTFGRGEGWKGKEGWEGRLLIRAGTEGGLLLREMTERRGDGKLAEGNSPLKVKVSRINTARGEHGDRCDAALCYRQCGDCVVVC